MARLDAWRDAKGIADQDEDLAVLNGSGTSMAPLYGDSSMIVVNEIAFNILTAGMNVAFLNDQGRRVIHRLIEWDADGNWIVKGINNNTPDTSRVTPKNLIGVVYASFSYQDSEEYRLIAKRGGLPDSRFLKPQSESRDE